jgi:hypothetical protein
MATRTVNTQPAPERTISIDKIDKLGAASAKLDALLACTYGGPGESFRDMSDDLQDNYLWACSDLAGEIKTLVGQL